MQNYIDKSIDEIEQVVDRYQPQHYTLTPLQMLALTNWEVKCEQRELGVLPSEKECD